MLKKIVIGFWVSLLFLSGFNLQAQALEGNTVILAVTTSIQDTGLLDVLVDAFQRKSKYTIKAVAVGTGQALQLGRKAEADILWVHSPDDEIQFVEEGYGVKRIIFIHNDFVLLGPATDPAKILRTKNITEAFRKIHEAKALFLSRGDKSGTHKKEIQIWREVDIYPENERYLETGQGMAQTIQIANETQAYCLADRSTYLSLKKSLKLVIASEGDARLRNDYSLILVNPEKFRKVNAKGAQAFFDFLLSIEAKKIIEAFGKIEFGEQLFYYNYPVK